MKEKTVEKYLRERVEANGGLCEKHVSPGLVGVPDRLVTWRDGRMFLVETKAPKKGPRKTQLRDHKRRADRGVKVWVIRTHEETQLFLSHMFATERLRLGDAQ